MGTATAAELDSWDAARYADSNDYSARIFYKLDFGVQASFPLSRPTNALRS